jgi:hypothetical protein
MQIDNFSDLSHYGTKGMHWGVRKARTGDVAKVTQRLDRVAKGEGSLRDKTVAIGRTKVYKVPKLLTKDGLANEASRQSEELKAHSERLSTGHATAKDILQAYGSTSISSIIKSMKD